MITITFQMMPQDYYAGWKLRSKISKTGFWFLKGFSICIAGILALLVAFSVLHPLYLVCALFFVIFPILMNHSEKKSVMNEFSSSSVLNDVHTMQLQNGQMIVFNSFEKITVPMERVFAVREDKKYCYFLPSLKKGIYVLSKARYDGETLQSIMEAVRRKEV